MTIEYDCIVVGAGIVGSALAHTLARDGRSVVLLERDLSEPDRIVGELLQPGGVHALKALGLEKCLEGIDAITVEGYGVFSETDRVHLPYPSLSQEQVEEVDPTGKQPAIAFEVGKSFHHGRFIMKLREACRQNSKDQDETVIGVTCTRKEQNGDRLTVEFFAPLTFIVDGCFSKFRKEVPHSDILVRSHFAGVILEDCPLPMPNHGHVLLASPSPILLYQIGTRDTRILVDIPGKVPSAGSGALKAYMLENVMPQLPKDVRPSFEEAITNQRIRIMPNQFLPASLTRRKGVIVVGDAMNMRHPLTGGGMTVGFWDVVTLSRCLQPDQCPTFKDTDLVQKQLSTFKWKRKWYSSVINILAQALYELFSAGDDPDLNVLRGACFEYFKLGGKCVDHPVGLLAGLIPNPLVLFTHFFAVAFLGMGRLLATPFYPMSLFCLPPEMLSMPRPQHYMYLLLTVNWLLYITAVICSLPLNLLWGSRVVARASIIILPLIWKELAQF